VFLHESRPAALTDFFHRYPSPVPETPARPISPLSSRSYEYSPLSFCHDQHGFGFDVGNLGAFYSLRFFFLRSFSFPFSQGRFRGLGCVSEALVASHHERFFLLTSRLPPTFSVSLLSYFSPVPFLFSTSQLPAPPLLLFCRSVSEHPSHITPFFV